MKTEQRDFSQPGNYSIIAMGNIFLQAAILPNQDKINGNYFIIKTICFTNVVKDFTFSFPFLHKSVDDTALKRYCYVTVLGKSKLHSQNLVDDTLNGSSEIVFDFSIESVLFDKNGKERVEEFDRELLNEISSQIIANTISHVEHLFSHEINLCKAKVMNESSRVIFNFPNEQFIAA